MMFDVSDDRTDFVSTWLVESPEGTPPAEYSGVISTNIRDVINFTKSLGYTIEDLGNNLKKLELNKSVYYWYEENKQILLGVELVKKPQSVEVAMIGKYNKGQPPYASDLYHAILLDRKKNNPGKDNIGIMSDKFLSDEGLRIWEKLLLNGHKILIYNEDEPGQSQIRITTIDELHSFFKMNDPAYRKYRYVLSEEYSYPDLIAIFNRRRVRELHNVL